MHVNVDKRNIKIDITNDRRELSVLVERIGKTANEIRNDPDGNRKKLNEPQRGYIIESNEAEALGCVGWAIEQHLNDMPSKLKPIFRKILEDTKARKENPERS